MLYAFANKFLDNEGLNEIMEAIDMTKLGQMLVEKGWVEGRAEGEIRGTIRTILNMQKDFGLTDEVTLQRLAQELGVSKEEVQEELDRYHENQKLNVV